MILIFSPVRMDETLTASVAGDVLTLNGEELAFGPLANGATLPKEAIDNPWIAGPVERALDGTLTVPLILPHGGAAPQETLFPAPLNVTSGAVPLPEYGTMDPLAAMEDYIAAYPEAAAEILASADGENWHPIQAEDAE